MDQCVYCSKEFEVNSFKLRSLFHKEKFVCEDCAVEEDEKWLADNKTESKDLKQQFAYLFKIQGCVVDVRKLYKDIQEDHGWFIL